MKIALVAFGGHQRYSIHLANALSENVELLLVVPEYSKVGYQSLINDNINLFIYRSRRIWDPRNLADVRGIIKTIKKFGADLVHFQGSHPWFFPGLLRLRSIKKITTFHDVVPHIGEEKLRKQWSKWIFRKSSNHIIVHGEFLKNMMGKMGVAEDSIHVIPHGTYDMYRKWRSDGITEERNTILFFGRLWRYKGLEFLMKAEPAISRELPEFRIILAVHGEPLSNYDQFMVNRERYEIIDRYIPNEEVAELFQKAAIVVLPYIEASQSGILNIAYAFATPVVVTKVGALPEVVDDGETGLIVPPSDPEALAKAVVTILSDDKLRNEMGKNALKKAETDLSWDRIARTTVETYREALWGKELGK